MSNMVLGVDIGGTLSKIVFFEPPDDTHYNQEILFIKNSINYGSTGVRDPNLSIPWKGGQFHFINFSTSRLENAVQLLKSNLLFSNNEVILCTGGGAQKYRRLFRKELNASVIKADELACLLTGMVCFGFDFLLGINFVLENVPDELYYYNLSPDLLQNRSLPTLSDQLLREKVMLNFQRPSGEGSEDSFEDDMFPYLLVNVGSGVSILRVDTKTQFERVSGTPIG